MSVPYSQSTSEKEVMAELKKRTSSARNLYSSSSGKVDDESTRTALRKSITTADDIISATTSTTKPNVQSVNDAIGAISSTMNSVRKSISSRNASESSPSTPSGDIQKYAKSLLSDYGWDDGEWDSVDYIVTHESGWDPTSLNPSSGAIGLFQCLGHPECSAIAYKTDYKVQVKWGLNYIRNRYGTPTSAATFWKAHNWY